MKDAYMNLSFYQMWYFIRTIELGSYSRASQDLNVTQSTLSKCIQNIEQNLKMELFIREKNNLIPTEAAKKSLSGVEKDDCGNAGSCGRCTALYGWTK